MLSKCYISLKIGITRKSQNIYEKLRAYQHLYPAAVKRKTRQMLSLIQVSRFPAVY